MPQELDQLHSEFTRLRQLAHRRAWVPSALAPFEVRLTSLDSPNDVPFDALATFVNRFERNTGIALSLTGGGYGCFDLGLTPEVDTTKHGDVARAVAAVESAITNDLQIQSALNDLRVDLVRVETPRFTKTWRAFDDLEIAIATNRELLSDPSIPQDDIRGVFGADGASSNTYGIANVLISDMSRRQPGENLAKRIFRLVKRLAGRERDRQIIIRKLDLYSGDMFPEVLKTRVRNGAVVIVHGYANSFDTAIDACALGVYRARLHDLALLPVMFSWPADGSPINYTPDTNAAENSEFQLLEALDLLSDALGAVLPSVVAHSHGNKLLVRSLTTKVKDRRDKTHWLKRLVLIEPDVDQSFLEQRAAILADAADRIVLYHSANDRALKAASIVFNSVRAGQKGVRPEELDSCTADRLEIVDATSVASGWTKHAPHIESAEVVSDLYYLFQGHAPEKRHGLRPVSAARWAIYSPLAR